MNLRTLAVATSTLCAFLAVSVQAASDTQIPIKAAPRAPAPAPGAPMIPAGRSDQPDGYTPVPEWLGQTRAARPGKSAAYDIETVAEGFKRGFSLNFLPDGRMIVAERSGGRIKIVGRDGKISEVEGLPDVHSNPGQGIFEMRPDRAFATNRRVYLTYAVLPDNADLSKLPRSAGIAVVASATLSADDRRLENLRVLLDAEGINARVIQAPDGTLLITSAIVSAASLDVAAWPQPQQLDSKMGKVLRINTDGSIPRDNPFVGRKDAQPEIYAFGLRENQGVAINPRTGKLWVSEHGPRGGDEINIVDKGRNYGFPLIGYGHEYDGRPINGDRTFQDGMEQPAYFWTPAVAPAGIAFYTGKLFPEWQGNLFVSALAGKALIRLVLKGDRVIGEERLLTELKTRIRDVSEGPDGALYVLTEGASVLDSAGGKLLRLVPKK